MAKIYIKEYTNLELWLDFFFQNTGELSRVIGLLKSVSLMVVKDTWVVVDDRTD